MLHEIQITITTYITKLNFTADNYCKIHNYTPTLIGVDKLGLKSDITGDIGRVVLESLILYCVLILMQVIPTVADKCHNLDLKQGEAFNPIITIDI